ncbi:hypothetical protein [Pseudomonas vanderleydeniana]|uniref:DUF3077 domain-containing protein n=1 Tax=Pseudomonas vanderleydeniana TaxID=2745495 RepID=A0A9E6TSN9_9PSED|nr:hypothetical protein [Pseudomonas vanderleydeniana]QXI28380.1 hypothetical protein HU752_031635 [Pseudomonas vanderleydeniana]
MTLLPPEIGSFGGCEFSEQLRDMSRHLAMVSVHLIELAQSQVDGLLDQQH